MGQQASALAEDDKAFAASAQGGPAESARGQDETPQKAPAASARGGPAASAREQDETPAEAGRTAERLRRRHQPVGGCHPGVGGDLREGEVEGPEGTRLGHRWEGEIAAWADPRSQGSSLGSLAPGDGTQNSGNPRLRVASSRGKKDGELLL